MGTGRRAVVEEQDATWARTRSDGCMWAFVHVDQLTAEAWHQWPEGVISWNRF